MRTSTNFLVVLIFCLFFSCKKDNASIYLLKQAQNIVESKPNDALILLDSIPNPENMDKDNYMQYIVTHLQAKQRTQQDITNDTLIFEAQRYFDQKNNPEQAALAHYYAGRVYRAKNIPDKALKCFLQSEIYAVQCNNNVLAGKDVHIMGNLYLEQGIMDTAIVLYKKALNYYNKGEDTDKYKMQVTNEIGRSYDEIGNIDSSYVYFQRSMEYADILGDQEFKTYLSNNLGYIYFRLNDYDKALYYLNSTLRQTSDATTCAKAYLNLSYLYNAKTQPDSALYYTHLSEKCLNEITDNIALRGLYNSLVDYSKQTGDYKQALHYKELEDSIKNVIAKNERPLSLLSADKNFHLERKEKEANQVQKHVCLYLLIGGVVFIFLLILVVSLYRIDKKDKEEVKMQADKYRRIKDQLLVMADEYKDIEAEIAAMLDNENE